jgi:hypothetical protein
METAGIEPACADAKRTRPVPDRKSFGTLAVDVQETAAQGAARSRPRRGPGPALGKKIWEERCHGTDMSMSVM